MSLRRIRLAAFQSYRETASRPSWWLLCGFLILAFAFIATGLSFAGILTGSGLTIDAPVPQMIIWDSISWMMLPLVTTIYGGRIIRDSRQGTSRLLHSLGTTPLEQILGHFIASTLLLAPILFLVFTLQLLGLSVTPQDPGQKVAGWPFDGLMLVAAINFWIPTLVFGCISILVAMLTRSPLALQSLWMTTWFISMISDIQMPGLSNTVIDILAIADPTRGIWFSKVLSEPYLGTATYSTMTMWEAFVYKGNLLLWNRIIWLLVGAASFLVSVWALSRRLHHRHRIAEDSVAKAIGSHAPSHKVSASTSGTLPEQKPTSKTGTGRLRMFFIETATLLRTPGFWMWQAFMAISVFMYLGYLVPSSQAENQYTISTDSLIFGMGTFIWWVTIASIAWAAMSINRHGRSGDVETIINRTSLGTHWIVIGRFLASLVPGISILVSSMIGLLFTAIMLTIENSEQIKWDGMDPSPLILYYLIILLPGSALVGTTLLLGFAISRSVVGSMVVLAILALPTFMSYMGIAEPTWTTDWTLRSIRWSESAPFEYDRAGILLNRIMVLGLTVTAMGLAIRFWPRVSPDPVSTPSWKSRILRAVIQPITLMSLLTAIFAGCWLELKMIRGRENSTWEKQVEIYNRHFPTWYGVPQPTLESIDFTCDLDPKTGHAEITATLRARNLHLFKLRTIAFSLSPAFDIEELYVNVPGRGKIPCWAPYRDHMLFEAEAQLSTGDAVELLLKYSLNAPGGLGEHPGQYSSPFILPGGVLLSRWPGDFSFLPEIGFSPTLEQSSYRNIAGDHKLNRAMGGLDRDILINAKVTVPDGYQVNLPGELTSVAVNEPSDENGIRTRSFHWITPEPVAPLFHLVAGRWDVQRGKHGEVWHDPAHLDGATRALEALEAAVPAFTSWFGKLPYDTIRVNEFPFYTDYSQSADQNIVVNEFVFRLRETEEYDLAYSTTAHEIAHLWWGVGLVPAEGPGGNVISEGLAEYSTIRLLQHDRGDEARKAYLMAQELIYLDERNPSAERAMSEIDHDSESSQVITYQRAGWMFWMAAQILGIERHDAELRAMAEHYSTRFPPVLDDYIRWMSANAGDEEKAFNYFADMWMRDSCVNEFVISEVECRPIQSEGDDWKTTLKINLGDIRCTPSFPITVAIFGDEQEAKGPKTRAVIPGYSGWPVTLVIDSDFKPDHVVVDPGIFVLQKNREYATKHLP